MGEAEGAVVQQIKGKVREVDAVKDEDKLQSPTRLRDRNRL